VRIVQVANFVHPRSGGLATALAALRTEYEALGHEVYDIVPEWGDTAFDGAHRRRFAVPSVRLPWSGGYRVIAGRRRARRLLEQIGPDVVELHDKSTLAWVARWCERRGVPVVVISHERTDLVPGRVPLGKSLVSVYVKRARRIATQHATAVVCASRFAAEEFGRDTKVHVVPLGVDAEVFLARTRVGGWRDPLVVTVCSRLSVEKGVDVAVEGFLALAERMSVRLRVLGDGPLKPLLEQRVAGHDAVFLGHVPDRGRVAAELASADVVLSLGPMETFGLTTLEALASGTPVVVSTSGASPEYVDDSFGRVSPPHGPSIAAAVVSMLSTSREVMSRSAREKAMSMTWELTARSILATVGVVPAPTGGATRRDVA
jgi:alpha-1,6-mannosyltransferase